jgi:hypothetical protein
MRDHLGSQKNLEINFFVCVMPLCPTETTSKLSLPSPVANIYKPYFHRTFFQKAITISPAISTKIRPF